MRKAKQRLSKLIEEIGSRRWTPAVSPDGGRRQQPGTSIYRVEPATRREAEELLARTPSRA